MSISYSQLLEKLHASLGGALSVVSVNIDGNVIVTSGLLQRTDEELVPSMPGFDEQTALSFVLVDESERTVGSFSLREKTLVDASDVEELEGGLSTITIDTSSGQMHLVFGMRYPDF